jgi:hypothetical protein
MTPDTPAPDAGQATIDDLFAHIQQYEVIVEETHQAAASGFRDPREGSNRPDGPDTN